MLKCTINGKEVEVKEGSTIIEAFHKNQIDLAYYCWHPGLSVAGVCRLCMVEIEGNPRLQIACNTQVTDGMVINNNSPKVKEAVKWGLDFHLINHPLDCPICDQAGECGLQEQYMQYGRYDSEMAERKVKKKKVVSLGERVVLDSERCILCSRCVRFTDEVSKSHELGIFNRGDHSEIGTFDGRPLNNKYSLNTVDICPVGALTSKDFRFRQRVWFLKEAETICTGCSTGCNVKFYYNREGLFRVLPVYNKDVNGYWMCDEGRDVYKFVNKENRLLAAKTPARDGGSTPMSVSEVTKSVGEHLRSSAVKSNPQSVALVLTGQHTIEEYEAIIGFFKNEVGTDRIFHWINNPEKIEEFDGLLLRGDKNPNTKGLLEVLSKHEIEGTWSDLLQGLQTGAIQTVLVVGPENQVVFPEMNAKIQELSKAKKLIWLTSGKNEILESLPGDVTLIPLKTYVEKRGTFVNHAGLKQVVEKRVTIIPEALSVEEVAALFAGRDMAVTPVTDKIGVGRIHNQFTQTSGAL